MLVRNKMTLVLWAPINLPDSIGANPGGHCGFLFGVVIKSTERDQSIRSIGFRKPIFHADGVL